MDHKPDFIRLTVSVPFGVVPDEVGFVSHCPSLDVYSQGHTEDEAVAMLAEALQSFIESCYRRGVLESVLNECGFEAVSEMPPIDDVPMIDVPIPLLARA